MKSKMYFVDQQAKEAWEKKKKPAKKPVCPSCEIKAGKIVNSTDKGEKNGKAV